MVLLPVVFICSGAEAAEGDRPIALTFTDGGASLPLGSGFIRGGDLWVPDEAIRRMGVQLCDGPNGKGFIINVQNPAQVFDIPELVRLAGNVLPLYFASVIEDKVSYFNVKGMELVTNIEVEDKGNEIMFKRKGLRENSIYKTSKPANEIKGRLSMVWAHITRDNPNLEDEQKIDGLDIVSPTWFNLTDSSGNMANRASVSYVEAAHRKGYRVWALVSNGFSKANTAHFFEKPNAVNLFIARILAYAKLYDLDGINIDFENVDSNNRDEYVRFMALLGQQLRAQGLKSSVDVHVPGNSDLSRSHDRAGLAKHVDYVMLMAYDEHWRTSPKSGSVASMPWVERAIQNTLKEGVPAEKLVLGVPFYMRRWEETPIAGGKVKVKGYTMTMNESDAIVIARGLSPIWINDLGQHFYSYLLNGKTYKVWVENEESITRKLQIVDKYRLAGAAGWRKGHEKPEIWTIFKNVLNK